MAVALYHVPDVVGLRAEVEMARIQTRGRIARMEHREARRNQPVFKRIGDSMD
jgi:hypothetical protein